LDVNFTDDKTFTTLKWDGFSVAQWFRRFEDLRSIPIVLISGDTSAATKEKALESGADAYFAKPMDFRQLLTTVLPMLGERTAAAG
jgi:DNA-binding response OmpR family regulator